MSTGPVQCVQGDRNSGQGISMYEIDQNDGRQFEQFKNKAYRGTIVNT